MFKNQKISSLKNRRFKLITDHSGKEFLVLLYGMKTIDVYEHILNLFKENGFEAVGNYLKNEGTEISACVSEYDYSFKPSSNTYVLSVGINEYPRIPKLKTAVSDCILFADTMKKYCFVPWENIYILTDENATKENIINSLKSLSSAGGRNKDVIFFFSGHGRKIPDLNGDEEDGFDEAICPWDAEENENSTYFTDDEIADCIDLLEDNSRRLTFIIDACFSGSAFKAFGMNLLDTREICGEFYRDPAEEICSDTGQIPGQGFCFFSSSKSGELSFGISDDFKNGLFTHFLTDAFKGFAETNGDGMLDSNEIYEYIRSGIDEYARKKGIYFQSPVRYPEDDFLIIGEFQN